MAALDVPTQTLDYWAIAGRVAVVVAIASSAVALFFGRAIARAVFVAAMKLAATDVKTFIEELFQTRIKETDTAMALATAHESQISDLKATMDQHNTALVDSVKQEFARQTKSMETIAESMTKALDKTTESIEALTKDTADTAREVANIAGYLRATSGEGFSQLDRRGSGVAR